MIGLVGLGGEAGFPTQPRLSEQELSMPNRQDQTQTRLAAVLTIALDVEDHDDYPASDFPIGQAAELITGQLRGVMVEAELPSDFYRVQATQVTTRVGRPNLVMVDVGLKQLLGRPFTIDVDEAIGEELAQLLDDVVVTVVDRVRDTSWRAKVAVTQAFITEER